MNNVNQRVAFIVATIAEKNKDNVKNEIAIAYNPNDVNPAVLNNMNPFFL